MEASIRNDDLEIFTFRAFLVDSEGIQASWRRSASEDTMLAVNTSCSGTAPRKESGEGRVGEAKEE